MRSLLGSAVKGRLFWVYFILKSGAECGRRVRSSPAHVLFTGRPDGCGVPDLDVLNGPKRYLVVAQTIDHLKPRDVDAQARPPLGCVHKPGQQNQPGCSAYRGMEISGNQQPRQRPGGAYPLACGHRSGRCRTVRFGRQHRRITNGSADCVWLSLTRAFVSCLQWSPSMPGHPPGERNLRIVLCF